uniref:Uncharacterized protein n=1 Tax=Oryza glumipatula TaxID=40148 RepID=A0A0E0A2Z1_9ORYZ
MASMLLRSEHDRVRRMASRLKGVGKGGHCAASSVREREFRSVKGRKEVEKTKWRRRWQRPCWERCGGWKGEGRTSSVAWRATVVRRRMRHGRGRGGWEAGAHPPPPMARMPSRSEDGGDSGGRW